MNKSLSPLDGRYGEKVTELAQIFSESGLIRSRIAVEVNWLLFISNTLKLEGTSEFSDAQVQALKKLYLDFQDEFVDRVKEHEKKTNHDVKAVEYFLQDALRAMKRNDAIPFLHFACTSEDINNIAYAVMLRDGVNKVLIRELEKLLAAMKDASLSSNEIAMMSRTHGQPATPTTVGKELKNFGARLFRQIEHLKKSEYFAKINGATGNFNAHIVAYPDVNWLDASKRFIESMDLSWQKFTTQIEPHDYMAEIFDNIRRINTILLDFNRDVWNYISLGYFKQKLVDGEVGSSTMPHKVNPIDFENSEGNLGMSNALLSHFSQKLPISRMQRDLSDSTVQRNIGVALGYGLLAYKSTLRGLLKLELNKEKLKKDLDDNWELLAEPIQTVMRRYGISDAYEQLKSLTRGEDVTQNKIKAFIESLKIPEDAKKRLLVLTPATYIGLANKL